MTERAVLIRLRPGLYRAHSRNTRGRSYKIHVALLKIHGWSAVCDCPGHLSHKHCYHADEAAQKEYEYMTTDVAKREQEGAVTVFARLPVPNLDPGTIVPSNILPTPGEIAAMAHIANLMTPDDEDPRETFKKELAGWELGVGPMTAIRRMFTVNNKIEPDTQLMLALALAGDSTVAITADVTGEAYNDLECVAVLKRGGVTHPKITYTMKDANASGQSKKKRRWSKWKKNGAGQKDGGWEEVDGPWQLYPKDMLKHAAVKRLLRLYAPDLINNVKGVGIGHAEVMIAGPNEDVIDAVVMESRIEARDEDPIQRAADHIEAEYVRQHPEAVNDDPHEPPVEDLNEHLDRQQAAPEGTDTTDYRAVVVALLGEAKENTDAGFFEGVMEEIRANYKYAIVIKGNKLQLTTAKLTDADAQKIALMLRTRIYGDGPPAEEGSTGEPAAAAEAIDPEDLPFE